MRLSAPAKINWTLEVLSRRNDGFHEVRTVMQTVDLCDTLDIGVAERIEMEVEGPHETTEDDLVIRAAAALGEAGGRGAHIRLVKRIPVAAGLGGGSSDAAAALRGLNELWGLGDDDARLVEEATRLGSDVAFFVHGGTALAEGRGERVTPLPDVAPTWLVLVAPPLDLPEKTKHMYGALTWTDFTDGSRTETLANRIRGGGAIDDSVHNAFERVAYGTFEGLGIYREALLAAGARRVHLAGSGPALFALGPDEESARAVYRRMRLSGGKAFVVRTLTAAEARAKGE
jgi:4-diphosphocytidyl-2-C-methyl-D-erythritol kinase